MRIHNALILILIVSPKLTTAQTHVWEAKANGGLVVDCNGADPGGEFFWPTSNRWSQAQILGNDPCPPFNPGFIREPSNWNTFGIPDSPAAQVLINTGPAAILHSERSVGTLTTSDGGSLEIQTTGALNVHGGTIDNQTMIDLNDVGGDFAILRLHAPTNLTGGGKIRFVSDDDNVIESNSAADILTIGPNQELLAMPDALAGTSASRLRAAVTNNGTITIDAGGLRIDTFDKTNNSVIRAINGGLASIHDIAIDNTNGTITANTGSTVLFDAVNVTGGRLDGGGTFDVASGYATFRADLTIAPESLVYLEGSDILTVVSGVTNNGLILLNDLGGSLAILRIDGNATLDGSGVVEFRSDDDNVIDSVTATDVLTIGPDQTLLASANALAGDSQSRIITAAINDGTITADQGGLQLDTNDKTNNNLIRAVNGGKIRISGITIDNATGTITSGDASTVELHGGILSGGLLNGSGPVQLTTSDATFQDSLTIAPETSVVLNSGDRLKLVGTLVNNGLIELRDSGGSSAELQIIGNVALNGNGTVLFNTDDDNTIIASSPSDVLTVGPDQELLTGPDAVGSDGACRVIAALTNNGTFTAEVGGLQFDGEPKTNNSLMQTLNGGTFRIRNTSIDNSNGTIELDGAGTLYLSVGTITGGLIDGTGAVVSTSSSDHLDGPLELGSGVTARTGTSRVLHVSGEITNNGIFELNDTGGGIAYLRIDGDTTLQGSGQVVFNTDDDNYLDSVNDADALTNGANHTITTSAATLLGESRLRAVLNNQGVVEARVGDLTLDQFAKTNNGTFRAIDGGELEVRSANTILTNYSAGTLTGGRWEVIASGSVTTMDLQGATITSLGPGTEVSLHGALALFPALSMIASVEGSLAIRNQQKLQTTGDLAISGRLEFGLTDGAVDGADATRLEVDGNVDFTGAFIDVADLGFTSGIYEVATWTGSRTGNLPAIGNVPAGTSVTVSTGSNSLFLNLSGGTIAPPVILAIDYDPETNTSTITYQSVSGEAFGVLGGLDLQNFNVLPDTAVGNGSVLQYTHNPPGSPGAYFYQLTRN